MKRYLVSYEVKNLFQGHVTFSFEMLSDYDMVKEQDRIVSKALNKIETLTTFIRSKVIIRDIVAL
jgi:hypothetical protein